jgi:hypothetical protein
VNLPETGLAWWGEKLRDDIDRLNPAGPASNFRVARDPGGMSERNRWSVDPTPAKPVLVSVHGTANSNQLLSGSM